MSVLSTESIAQIAFWVTVGITVGGAVLSVFPINIVYNVFGMAFALSGVAGLYLYLSSPFMAMMQLLIYVGAICIAIVFAIMLSRPLYLRAPSRETFRMVMGVAASLVFFTGLVGIIVRTPWKAAAERGNDWSAEAIGHMLLTRYDLVFEVISLVLLVAIIGAIITAGYRRRRIMP